MGHNAGIEGNFAPGMHARHLPFRHPDKVKLPMEPGQLERTFCWPCNCSTAVLILLPTFLYQGGLFRLKRVGFLQHLLGIERRPSDDLRWKPNHLLPAGYGNGGTGI